MTDCSFPILLLLCPHGPNAIFSYALSDNLLPTRCLHRLAPHPVFCGSPMKEIRSLTGLRGIAACYVMAYHFRTGWHPPHIVAGFVNHGYLAVDLFFVLSGFVLSLTYGHRMTTWAAHRDFLTKRLGRVYPLYFVATVTALLLWQHIGSGGELAANGLLVQSWGLAEPYLGPTWSISTEFAVYVLFPVLAWVMLRRGDQTAVCAVLAVCVLWWLSTRSSGALGEGDPADLKRGGPLDIYTSTTLYPVLRCLAGFVLGMAAFRLAKLPAIRNAPAWLTTGLCVLICALLAVPKADVAIVLLCMPFVALLSTSNSAVVGALAWGPIYWLGLVSYSIYLDHALVDEALHTVVGNYLKASGIPHAFSLTIPVLCAISMGCAAVTYRVVEEPCRNAVRRLFYQPRTLIEPEIAAP